MININYLEISHNINTQFFLTSLNFILLDSYV